MKRRFTTFTMPPWVSTARDVAKQFAVPICVLQGLRTLLFPTVIDVLLLGFFILAVVAVELQWI